MEPVFYGDETKKAAGNFGKGVTPPELLKAYAEVKKAVLAAVQEKEKILGDREYKAVLMAVDSILSGERNGQFVLPLKQGGAGTSINMNMNEVIAGIANQALGSESIDPIDHVNRGQSTNDTFSTAVTIVLYRKLEAAEKMVIELQETLVRKETEYGNILMAGRTEMQTALPVTLGQVFASWAGGIERDRWRLNKLKERIRTIALGGTAVGTGFGAYQETVFLSEKHLRSITGLPLTRSQNLTDEIAGQDKLSELAGGLRLVAENIFKMTGDLLIYTSSMVGEIDHPHLQYGSTIMAAKTNPVALEFARGLSIDVIHEADKISEYCRNGQLQLNAYLPFILNSFLVLYDSLEKAVYSLVHGFFDKMTVNYERIEKNLLESGLLLNLLLPVMDYHKIKELYELCAASKPATIKDLKKLISENSVLKAEDVEFYFDPANSASYRKDRK